MIIIGNKENNKRTKKFSVNSKRKEILLIKKPIYLFSEYLQHFLPKINLACSVMFAVQ